MLTETIDMFLSPERYDPFFAFTTAKLKFSDWIELYGMSFYFFFIFKNTCICVCGVDCNGLYSKCMKDTIPEKR